jgi:hypothetical protein
VTIIDYHLSSAEVAELREDAARGMDAIRAYVAGGAPHVAFVMPAEIADALETFARLDREVVRLNRIPLREVA